MATSTFSDKEVAAINWCKQHLEKTGLSFVLKIHDLQFRPVENKAVNYTWRDYRKPSKDPDILEVWKLDQQTVSNRDPEPGWKADIHREPYLQALNLTSLVKKILFDYFKNKSIEPTEVNWFIQSELGKDSGLHFHVLLQSEKIPQASGKWIQKFFAEKWGLLLTGAVPLHKDQAQTFFNQTRFRETVENNEWVQVLCYTHPQTKKKYVKPIFYTEMIVRYFLTKQPCMSHNGTGYCYTSDSGFIFGDMNSDSRKKVAKHIQDMLDRMKETTVTDTSPQEKKKKRVESQKETTIKETIQTLSNKRLHTQEKWMLGDPDSYIAQVANPGGETIIKAALDIVTLKMSVEKTAFDLILENQTKASKTAKHTKAWKIIKKNGYNPYQVYHAIICCLNKQMGKRNTILLCGPASTGKSLLAQKICHLVGNVGCYNAANVNFPFNDCSNKNIIWVEEAGNFGTQVNQFKTIMSGQAIRLDQKGKGSKTIEPTPVIMTTNEDITKVIVGSETKPEHKQPIMDRCVRIELKNRLDGDFGLLEDWEIPCIFRKLLSKGFEPTLASYCKRWGAPPTWHENWNTKPINCDVDENEEEEPEPHETNSKEPVEITDTDFDELIKGLEEDFAAMEDQELGYGQELLGTPDASD
uniref:Initiator protein NS1 n=1 Tax=Bufavirus Henan38 TaxID=2820082 RepID=A0A8A4R4E1_9VIRU|nr:NS1 [Bufavirus Henan38]